MAVPVYTYLFCDLATNTPLDELPLSQVTFGQTLNTSGTLTGTLTLGPALANRNAYDLTTPCRRAIYALRDGVPVWGGIIWTRAYDSTKQQVAIGAGDWWSYFDHRKVLPVLALTQRAADGRWIASNPTQIASGAAVSYTADQNQVARNLVALAQSHTNGDIGVQFDSALSVVTMTRTYNGYDNTWVGAALTEIATSEGGPDLLFDVGPLDTSGRPARLLRTGDPTLGQQGAPWVWEFGGNLLSYQWPSDGTRYASRVFAAGNGTEQAALIQACEDRSMYGNNWPLIEIENSYSQLADTVALQAHADSDQAVARLPVVVPQLMVRGDVWPTFDQVSVGDTGTVSIQDWFFPQGMTTSMRIVGSSVSPAETIEHVTLSMNPLLEDVV